MIESSHWVDKGTPGNDIKAINTATYMAIIVDSYILRICCICLNINIVCPLYLLGTGD